MERLFFEAPMLAAIAFISNSRALTKAETSRSPLLFNALSEAWARIVLADEVLTRLAARLEDGGGLLDWGGCLRLSGPEGAIMMGGKVGRTKVNMTLPRIGDQLSVLTLE